MKISLKSIRDLFARAAAFLPRPAAKAAPVEPGNTNVSYEPLVNLFGFRRDDRFVTEPQKQWAVRQVMGLDVQSRMAISTNFGDIRVFYADPKQTMKIEHKWKPNTIMPPDPPIIVPSSPAIFGSEDYTESGHSLIVAIRDRVTDPEKPMENIAFALYGWTTSGGGLRFKKILVPGIDNANRMTGLREVNLRDRDDVARALTYAKMCADQLLKGQNFTPRQNMKDVIAMNASQLHRVDWQEKKESFPAYRR